MKPYKYKDRNFLLRIFFIATFLVFLYPDSSSLHEYYVEPSASCPITHPDCIEMTAIRDTRTECVPRNLHLSQASDVQVDGSIGITVSFSIGFYCRGVEPVISYGPENVLFKQSKQVPAKNPVQFNYTSKRSEGVYYSDWIYHVELENLKAGMEKYWYRIIIEEEEAALEKEVPVLRGSKYFLRSKYDRIQSPSITFTTPPLEHSPTSLALVGDLGQTENSSKTMMHIWGSTQESRYQSSVPVSQLLIAGDMSYADADPYRWDRWWRLIQPLSRSTSMHVAAGNHEIECDTSNNVFQPYEHWFHNPNRIANAESKPITNEYRDTLWHGECAAPSVFVGEYNYGNSFYAYKHGLTQIVVLNSYTNSSEGSPQYKWLAQELASFNRTRTPWLIVSFHAPLYTTFLGHVNEREAMNMRKSMEPLFREAGVNLIINGHDHAYMRTKSLYNGTVDSTGKSPIYLTLGAGGNREQHSAGYRHPNKKEDWVAVRSLQDYGYAHLFLPNATHARLHWLRDGVTEFGIQDAVWLRNAHV